MNIILVSGGSSRVRSFAVGTRQIAMFALMFALTVVALAALMHYFTMRHAVTTDAAYLRPLLSSLQAQENARTRHNCARV